MVCAALDKFIKIIFTLLKRCEINIALAEKTKSKSKSSKNVQNYSFLNNL
jgi:hypothetical protein